MCICKKDGPPSYDHKEAVWKLARQTIEAIDDFRADNPGVLPDLPVEPGVSPYEAFTKRVDACHDLIQKEVFKSNLVKDRKPIA